MKEPGKAVMSGSDEDKALCGSRDDPTTALDESLPMVSDAEGAVGKEDTAATVVGLITVEISPDAPLVKDKGRSVGEADVEAPD